MLSSAVLRLAFVLWGVWCVSSGFATQFLPVPIEELARTADVVLRGEVVSRSCERDPRGRLTTRIELAVSEVWKGAPTTHFTVVQAGGTLGEQRQTVIGQAEYRIGEEVVAFLALNRSGEGVTLGLAHGKFSLVRSRNSGELLAQSAFLGHVAPAPEMSLSISAAPRTASRASLGSPLTVERLKEIVARTAP
ncbi:hypothetical protein LBMAG56_45790 [Verrucomicrobiota bacterium]|nr:hypothetical protein LBMAG56_45790 [Verrucomicrobiota bacterium]